MQNQVSKFCKVYARQNQKTNMIYLYKHAVETFTLILLSKIVFKQLLWLKLSIVKYPLIPSGNKRSHT